MKSNSFDTKAVHRNAPVYHTNVVMAIAEKFVVCCLEVVTEKENLLKELSLLDKKLIFISSVQMDNFCGNILQVSNLICMSTRGGEIVLFWGV